MQGLKENGPMDPNQTDGFQLFITQEWLVRFSFVQTLNSVQFVVYNFMSHGYIYKQSLFFGTCNNLYLG